MTHHHHHHSTRNGLLDCSRQRQNLRLSGFGLAVSSSQSKTTDGLGMPTVSGSQRKGLHGHAGQVRPLLYIRPLQQQQTQWCSPGVTRGNGVIPLLFG